MNGSFVLANHASFIKTGIIGKVYGSKINILNYSILFQILNPSAVIIVIAGDRIGNGMSVAVKNTGIAVITLNILHICHQ